MGKKEHYPRPDWRRKRRNPNAPKFKPWELEKAIDEYFISCRENGEKFSQGGLAFAIGVTPQTLRNYKARNDQLTEIIEDALAVHERQTEEMMTRGENVKACQYILNALYNWRLKTESTVTNIQDMTC